MNLTLRKRCDRCGWQNAVRVQWLTLEGQAQWPCQACGQPLKASAWQAIYDEHSPRARRSSSRPREWRGALIVRETRAALRAAPICGEDLTGGWLALSRRG